MPELLNVDEPTRGATELSIEEADRLIAWLRTTAWASCLEANLQCISEDRAQRPLLTSWLSREAFEQFVTDAQGEFFGQSLKRMKVAWVGLGMTSVYFDAYLAKRADRID